MCPCRVGELIFWTAQHRDVWDEEPQEHINVLEMPAVELALASFLPQLVGESVVLMSYNMSVVAYLQHQGGTVSRCLCQMASAIIVWAESRSVLLEALYMPGKKNIPADQLSCLDQILPTEWFLLPRVFDGICWEFGLPHLDLLGTWANSKLPLYVFPVPDPLAGKQDILNLPCNHLDMYAFSLFALLHQVITRLLESGAVWPQKEWFADLLDLLVAKPLELPRVWNLLMQPHVRKAGFSKKVVRVVAADLKTFHYCHLPFKVDPTRWLV